MSELDSGNKLNLTNFELQPMARKSGLICIEPSEKKFIAWTSFVFILAVALPTIFGYAIAKPGSLFIGYPFNTDDHMVYAAWIHQAMNGNFFFNNRFAIESQPSQTIHLYYFLLGQIARFIGIRLTSNLSRIVFAGIFVPILYYFVCQFNQSVYTRKLCLILTLIGGGLGFLVWHNFGRELVIPDTLWMGPITQGILPTDVWQPEGFVFSSMLTNGLFAVSLCLIVGLFSIVLSIRQTANRLMVGLGAILFAILMNIHSYDALLVTFVLIGFFFTSVGAEHLEKRWLISVFLIGLGAVPPSLWFIHVIHVDRVFADRALTPTVSADFRAVLMGYLPLIIFGLFSMFRGTQQYQAKRLIRRKLGLGIAIALIVALTFLATPRESEMLTMPYFSVVFIFTLLCCYLLADDNPAFNLVQVWALVGLIAPYFPALFQRKLAMGLSIPWAILAGYQLGLLFEGRWRSSKNFASILLFLMFGGSSVQWLVRQITLIKENVASTTVQPCYLNKGTVKIIRYLNAHSHKRVVVVAMPGIPSQAIDEAGNLIPDLFQTPLVPDLNPILSGLSGVYTYAGHWSETPDYDYKRANSLKELFGPTATLLSGQKFLSSIDANYIVGIRPNCLPYAHLNDIAKYGKVIVKGRQFLLVKIR